MESDSGSFDEDSTGTDPDTVLEQERPLGVDTFGEIGIQTKARYNSRNDVLSSGIEFKATGAYYPELWDVESAFGSIIPRIIELRQWSVATDLYGIGALFLYTLFNGKDAKNLDRKKTAESDFHRMLKELESVPYFQNMWSYIGPLCTLLALIEQ